MLKTRDGHYQPGTRSNDWLKMKKDYVQGMQDSLDLVVIGAWHGNGRKVGWYRCATRRTLGAVPCWLMYQSSSSLLEGSQGFPPLQGHRSWRSRVDLALTRVHKTQHTDTN